MGECIVHRADGTTSVCPFGQWPVILGRGASASVRIDDEYMSRSHCEVSVRENRIILKDLKSHNGTLVNGQPIQEMALTTGDKIQLGETQITFQIAEKVTQPEKPGEQSRRDLNAIFRIVPASPSQAVPSDTVKIPLPQVAPSGR